MTMTIAMIMVMMMALSVLVFMAVHDVAMRMFVAMALMTGASEKSADLVRGKIRDYLHPFLEFIRNPFYVMCLHDGKHHLLIHRQGDVHLGALDRKSVV